MTLTEKVAYLKGLAAGLDLETEEEKEALKEKNESAKELEKNI